MGPQSGFGPESDGTITARVPGQYEGPTPRPPTVVSLGRQAAPHHDVGLLILDRFPSPQDAFSLITAPLGNTLRHGVVEMGHEMHSGQIVLGEAPIGDQIQRLGSDTPSSDSPIKPIKGHSTTELCFQLKTNLADATIRRGQRDRERIQPECPPLQPLLNPVPSRNFSQVLGHHREPGDVWVFARLGDCGRVINPERTQTNLLTMQGREGDSHTSKIRPVDRSCDPQEGFCGQ